MKRRGFLKLFGAAITTPLLPTFPVTATAATAPSRAALHGAILHAQSRRSISAWGISRALNIPPAQARLLMANMAERGILGPLQGHKGAWAISKVQIPIPKAGLAKRNTPKTCQSQTRQADWQVDYSALIRHLHRLCEYQNIPLANRARC